MHGSWDGRIGRLPREMLNGRKKEWEREQMVKASFWWYEKIMTFTRSELKWNTFSLRFPSIDFGKKT